MTPQARITTSVSEAAQVLLHGGIIGLPTETVYGLAAIATNRDSVLRVYSTKGRPLTHPLIIHLGTHANPGEWGDFNSQAQLLAKKFWPGPLTLLVPRTARVPDWVTGGRDTVALRVPSHPIAQQLLNEVNTGVVAPSANLFGQVSPTTAQHVADDLGARVDIILDGGTCDIGVESTIVECIDNTVRILRPGKISAEEILATVPLALEPDTGEERAPGMLSSHYAPHARVVLFDDIPSAQNFSDDLASKGQTTTVMHYDDVAEYAVNLYADLRLADLNNISTICAVLPPARGIGIAVRDRLTKAANTSNP